MLAITHTAFGDLYRYIDRNGVWHFTNSKSDDRYELYYRSPTPNEIHAVQIFLKELGDYFDKIDGIWSKETEHAVKKYQSRFGLSGQGLLTEETKRHMKIPVEEKPAKADETLKVKQATIRGDLIKVGQGADIVQSRIKADRYVSSGYNYGDLSKGYYNDAGTTYIITYGPPNSGTGGYVVKQIEKVTSEREKPTTSSSQSSKGTSNAGQPVTMGMLADTVLERRGKAISVKQVGSDENGLLVEWHYPDAAYLMGRRLQDGIEAYRVIKITPR